MRAAGYAIALLCLVPVGAAAQESAAAMQSAPLPDDVLAMNQGRFVLPSGQQLALSVRTDTSVDGQLILRSVLTVDQGSSLSVFAPGKSNEALGKLPIVVGGPAIETAGGAVRAIETAAGRTVSLSGNGLSVGQLIGPSSFGSVIANTASDRAIDTTTTVDIGLSDMSATLNASALLKVAALASSVARPPF